MSKIKDDLLNILFLARVLASADGEYGSSELEFFKKLQVVFDLTPDEVKSYDRTISIKDAINKLESNDAKTLLVDVLMVIASTDGDFADKEQIFIKKVMKMIDLNPSDYPIFKYGEEEVHKIFKNLDDFMDQIKEKVAALDS